MLAATDFLTEITSKNMVRPARLDHEGVAIVTNALYLASDFADGESWGYRKYYDLSRLVSCSFASRHDGPNTCVCLNIGIGWLPH